MPKVLGPSGVGQMRGGNWALGSGQINKQLLQIKHVPLALLPCCVVEDFSSGSSNFIKTNCSRTQTWDKG